MLGTIAAEPSLELKSGDPTRLQLLKMLSLGNNDQQAAVVLKNLFPKFLKVSEFIFFSYSYITNCFTNKINEGSIDTVVRDIEKRRHLYDMKLETRKYKEKQYWRLSEVCDNKMTPAFRCIPDASLLYVFSKRMRLDSRWNAHGY